jgi:hypothetical protein
MSMHALGEDRFVIGTLMDRTWYITPNEVLTAKPKLTGTFNGTAHGAPGGVPVLELTVAEGEGESCTPTP